MSDTDPSKRPLVADKRYASAGRPKSHKSEPPVIGGKSAAKSAPKAQASSASKSSGKPAQRKAAPKKPTAKKPASRRGAPPRPPRGKGRRGGSGGGGGGRRPGILGMISGFVGLIFSLIWRVLWRLVAVAALIVIVCASYIALTLPPVQDLYDVKSKGSVTMVNDQGSPFAWRGSKFAGVITTKDVSPNLKHAIIATEDKRFYHELAVSPRGILSAMKINLTEGRGALSGNGGSTITQQTAKLLCMGHPYDPKKWKNEAAYESDCRQATLWRKAREAVYAFGLEMRYSKDDILTIYMNRAYLGEGSVGFEAAAQRYFGKSARDVTPAEAAMLAGLLKAPTRYDPTNNLARSQGRAKVIIGLMEDQGYLTHAQAVHAIAHPAQLSPQAKSDSGGYFADWAMSSAPDFLTKKSTRDVTLDTTLDPKIEAAVENAIKDIYANKIKDGSKAQVAAVVMSPDGAVRAMVGGSDVKGGGVFNRATQALRQTGSAFKPFVYGAAMDLGWHWYDKVANSPLTINIPGSGPWSPQNYERTYSEPVTLATALAESLNIPAVRVAEAVGLENVRRVATDFGITTDLAKGPSVALGASDTTLLDMVGAYAGILNGGSSVEPYGIRSIKLKGDDEPLMGQDGGIGERVIRQSSARELIYMMTQVVQRGSGRRAAFGNWQIAGKTGTSSDLRDAWFIGFTADYVMGVWMGNDNNTPLTGTTGGGLPAEIWHEAMSKIHEGLPPKPLPMDQPPAETPRMVQGVDVGMAPKASEQPQTSPQQQGGGNIIERALHSIFGGH